jgi:AcrR family transcriptional regulator
MAVASQAPTSRGVRREALLRAGVEIFEERAYEDVSIDEIADRAGVAHGLLFHYFETKRRFYVEVMRRIIAERVQRFASNAHTDPVKWLRRETEIFLDGLVEHRLVYLTLQGGGLEPEMVAMKDEFRDIAVARVCAAAGAPGAGPLVRLAVRGWVAQSMEIGHRWLVDGDVGRARVRELLARNLVGALEAAVAVDPRCGVDPSVFTVP